MNIQKRISIILKVFIIFVIVILFAVIWRLCDSSFIFGKSNFSIVKYDNQVLIGDVYAGYFVHGSFQIQNIGKKILKLDPLIKCSCVPITIDKHEVPEGEYANISFILKPKYQFGELNENIEILTNDPLQKKILIEIQGNVNKGIEASPYLVDFNYIKWGQLATKKVFLRSTDNKLKFISSMSSSDCIQHELVQDHNQVFVQVSVKHPFTSSELNEAIFIKTSNVDVPYVIIPVKASFLGPLYASPSSLLIMGLSNSKKIEKVIDIFTEMSGDLQIELDEKTKIFLNAEIEPYNIPNKYKITLSIDPAKIPNKYMSNLNLIFNDKDSKRYELIIPLIVLNH